MLSRNDIFAEPGALLVSTFDPRDYSFLGVALGDQAAELTGWNIAQTNTYGWHFLDGGVRFRVRDGVIAEIGLPETFLHQLGITTIRELLLCFGDPDDTSDIQYRGKVSVRGYIWHRGFIVWCSEIDESSGHVVFYDPTKPVPRIELEGT